MGARLASVQVLDHSREDRRILADRAKRGIAQRTQEAAHTPGAPSSLRAGVAVSPASRLLPEYAEVFAPQAPAAKPIQLFVMHPAPTQVFMLHQKPEIQIVERERVVARVVEVQAAFPWGTLFTVVAMFAGFYWLSTLMEPRRGKR